MRGIATSFLGGYCCRRVYQGPSSAGEAVSPSVSCRAKEFLRWVVQSSQVQGAYPSELSSTWRGLGSCGGHRRTRFVNRFAMPSRLRCRRDSVQWLSLSSALGPVAVDRHELKRSWRTRFGCRTLMEKSCSSGIRRTANQCVARTGGSRFAKFHFQPQRRLPPVAHADRLLRRTMERCHGSREGSPMRRTNLALIENQRIASFH